MYIFILAVTPCTDGQECGDVTEHKAHDHSDHEDTCTPFCTCHCCGITASFADFLNLNILEPKHSFYYNFQYTFTYSHDHSGSVWHPPLLT